MDIKPIAKPFLNKINAFVEALTENRPTSPSKSDKFKRIASHVSSIKPYELIIWALDFPNENGVSEFLLGLWLNNPNSIQLSIFDKIFDTFQSNTFEDCKFEKHKNGVWVRIPVNIIADGNVLTKKLEDILKYVKIVMPEIIKVCDNKIAGVKSKLNISLDYVTNWELNNDKVLIVAGNWALNIANKYGIYECQNYRSFRSSKYMAFYDDGIIDTLFEIIDKPYDNATEGNTPEIAKMAIEIPNYNGNTLRRCFKLKIIEKIGPIINDSIGKSGKKVPFTYGQARYTSLELIRKAKKTSELVHGLRSNLITDTFVNDRKKVSPKVDILWVIDNSGSMSSYQKSLGSNFKHFINQFLNKPIVEIPDFLMAVTTTDENDKGKLNTDGLLSKEYAVDEDLNEFFLGLFSERVNVGTNGSATEKGLKCASLALANNASFFRAEATLVINIVTDEEDDDTTDVNEYLNKLNAFKPGQRVIINVIGLPGFKRYGYAVNKTKGIYLNIKSDFNKVLENISRQMVEVTESFALTNTPLNYESIKCSNNGVETKDFEYNSTSNTIKAGISIPDGATLEIEYEIEES